ncbi:MAG TPA: hypothetical protein VGR69_04065 [Candidatus Rubrimentiphilum sp.]|nr:hypothetical protein [Candidatus Rubrimentiphilum sp.]
MNRFCAELIITLDDGKTVCEGFNQAEMAQFTRQRMLKRLHDGLPLVHYDGERIEIPSERVADVSVVVHDLIPA